MLIEILKGKKSLVDIFELKQDITNQGYGHVPMYAVKNMLAKLVKDGAKTHVRKVDDMDNPHFTYGMQSLFVSYSGPQKYELR